MKLWLPFNMLKAKVPKYVICKLQAATLLLGCTFVSHVGDQIFFMDADPQPPPQASRRDRLALPSGAGAEGVGGQLLEGDLLVDLDLEHLQVGGQPVRRVYPHVGGRPVCRGIP
jgi:hypothetical protein